MCKLDIKQIKSTNINCILQNTDLNLKTKQINLETELAFNLTKDLNKNILSNLHSKLLNINWLDIEGNIFIKKLLNVINIETLIDYIIIRSLLKLKYIKCVSLNYFKNMLLFKFLYFAKFNNIKIYHEELQIKFENKEITYLILENSFIYIAEYLYKINIIHMDYNRYTLMNLSQIDIQDSLVLVNEKWPLIIPAESYTLVEENLYIGGYYKNKISLDIEKIYEQKLRILPESLKNINKLQNISYKLNKNLKVINFIEKIEKYFTSDFLNNNLQYIEDWYVSYQYLILIKNNIEEIYFPYNIDYCGQIHNAISFGINPTKNKLSKVLISFGKYKLVEESKNYLKEYICTAFNTSLDNFENLLNIDLNFNNDKVLKDLIDEYSIHNIILLIDWHENVLKNNESEILIELNTFENEFKILSILSNDYFGMLSTNLIESDNKINFCDNILEELKKKIIKKNKLWLKILDNDFLKDIIKLVVYRSSLEIKTFLLIKNFNEKYDLKHYNSLRIILESNIIYDIDLQNKIKEFSEKILNFDFNIESLEHIQELIIKDLKLNFFKILLKILNDIIKKLYPDIINFTKKIKKINEFITSFYIFSIEYFTFKYEKINFSYYIPSYPTFKTKLKILTEFIQSMGNSFFIHKFIELNNINYYLGFNFFLCKANDINKIQKKILMVYNFIYEYYLEYNSFQIFKNKKKYIINSLKIYNIKKK